MLRHGVDAEQALESNNVPINANIAEGSIVTRGSLQQLSALEERFNQTEKTPENLILISNDFIALQSDTIFNEIPELLSRMPALEQAISNEFLSINANQDGINQEKQDAYYRYLKRKLSSLEVNYAKAKKTHAYLAMMSEIIDDLDDGLCELEDAVLEDCSDDELSKLDDNARFTALANSINILRLSVDQDKALTPSGENLDDNSPSDIEKDELHFDLNLLESDENLTTPPIAMMQKELSEKFIAFNNQPLDQELHNAVIDCAIKNYIAWEKILGAPAAKDLIREILCGQPQLGKLEQAILEGLDFFDVLFIAGSTSVQPTSPAQRKYLTLQSKDPHKAFTTVILQHVLEIICEEVKEQILALENKIQPKLNKAIEIDTQTNFVAKTAPYSDTETKLISEKNPELDAETKLITLNLQDIRDSCKEYLLDQRYELEHAISAFVKRDSIFFNKTDPMQHKTDLIVREVIAALCEVFATEETERQIFLATHYSVEDHHILEAWFNQPEFSQLESKTRLDLVANFVAELDKLNGNLDNALCAALLNQANLHLEHTFNKTLKSVTPDSLATDTVPRGVLHAHRRSQSQLSNNYRQDRQEQNKAIKRPSSPQASPMKD